MTDERKSHGMVLTAYVAANPETGDRARIVATVAADETELSEARHDARIQRDLTRAAERELRAVRVLDAWARKHEGSVPAPYFHQYMCKDDGTWGCWSMSLTREGMQVIERFASAAEARIAAADALAKEDPSLLEGLT